MDIKLKLSPLVMPDFLNYVPSMAGNRQDGFNPDSNKVAVASLTREQAEEYGEMIKRMFISHWEFKTNKKTTEF